MKSNQSQFKSLKYAAIALFAFSSTNVIADQEFSTLDGIPAQVMSQQELSIVEGKSNLASYVHANQYGISNPGYRNPFSTNFNPLKKTTRDTAGRYSRKEMDQIRASNENHLKILKILKKNELNLLRNLQLNFSRQVSKEAALQTAWKLGPGFNLSPNAGFNPSRVPRTVNTGFPVNNFSQPNPGNNFILGLVNPNPYASNNFQTQLFRGY